ncbi:MAG TPA: hypothetical protein DEA22_08045 [Blastocatellia bacterium]|nr:hypothetical protein [Blastocatellia bacterium]
MLVYFLIGLSLSLAGVVGMQLAFGLYRDRLDNERKQRLSELEKKCRILAGRLNKADQRIAELEMHVTDTRERLDVEDNWADVIDDS